MLTNWTHLQKTKTLYIWFPNGKNVWIWICLLVSKEQILFSIVPEYLHNQHQVFTSGEHFLKVRKSFGGDYGHNNCTYQVLILKTKKFLGMKLCYKLNVRVFKKSPTAVGLRGSLFCLLLFGENYLSSRVAHLETQD